MATAPKLTLILALLALGFPLPLLGQAGLHRVSHGVQPGDELEVKVFTAAGARLDEISGTRIVDPGGEIYLPYLGSLKVAGMSAPEVRSLLEGEYGRLYNNPVVEVVTRLKVNVTGAVRSPGRYLLDPSSTFIDALGRAGGISSDVDIGWVAASDARRTRLVRGGEVFILDLRPETADLSVLNLLIQSGDWLHVPIQERSRVRERVQFWGGIVSVLASTLAVIFLLSG